MKVSMPSLGLDTSMWLTATGWKGAARAVPVGGQHHRPRVRRSNTVPDQYARTCDTDRNKGEDPLVKDKDKVRPGVWTRSGEAAVDLTDSNMTNRPLGKKSLE